MLSEALGGYQHLFEVAGGEALPSLVVGIEVKEQVEPVLGGSPLQGGPDPLDAPGHIVDVQLHVVGVFIVKKALALQQDELGRLGLQRLLQIPVGDAGGLHAAGHDVSGEAALGVDGRRVPAAVGGRAAHIKHVDGVFRLLSIGVPVGAVGDMDRPHHRRRQADRNAEEKQEAGAADGFFSV